MITRASCVDAASCDFTSFVVIISGVFIQDHFSNFTFPFFILTLKRIPWLMNQGICSTRPSLHIEASRIVEFPSGTSVSEFLFASCCVITLHNFSLRASACWALKKKIVILLLRFIFLINQYSHWATFRRHSWTLLMIPGCLSVLCTFP